MLFPSGFSICCGLITHFLHQFTESICINLFSARVITLGPPSIIVIGTAYLQLSPVRICLQIPVHLWLFCDLQALTLKSSSMQCGSCLYLMSGSMPLHEICSSTFMTCLHSQPFRERFLDRSSPRDVAYSLFVLGAACTLAPAGLPPGTSHVIVSFDSIFTTSEIDSQHFSSGPHKLFLVPSLPPTPLS
jgi:hypothetical protein